MLQVATTIRQYTDQMGGWPAGRANIFYRCLILIKAAARRWGGRAGGSRWVIAGWCSPTVTISLFTASYRPRPLIARRAAVASVCRLRVCVWRAQMSSHAAARRCKTGDITAITIIIISIIIVTGQLVSSSSSYNSRLYSRRFKTCKISFHNIMVNVTYTPWYKQMKQLQRCV